MLGAIPNLPIKRILHIHRSTRCLLLRLYTEAVGGRLLLSNDMFYAPVGIHIVNVLAECDRVIGVSVWLQSSSAVPVGCVWVRVRAREGV